MSTQRMGGLLFAYYTVNCTPSQKLNLLDLPSELLQWVIGNMTQEDRRSFVLACKRTYDLTLPALFRCISIKPYGNADNFSSLVSFLTTRPDVIEVVREIVMHKFDPSGVRHLLAISFPHLTKLVIRHVGPVSTITEDERVTLNRSIKHQPGLTDRKFFRFRASFHTFSTHIDMRHVDSRLLCQDSL
ncbi:hypothetical protein ES702_00245 [subsurface metagenome]